MEEKEKKNLPEENSPEETEETPTGEASLKEKENSKYLPYEDDDDEEDEDYPLPKNPFAEETPLAETTYTIHLEEYDKGFKEFQKKYAYPKNFIMTGIFLVIMALYGQQLYMDPKDGFRWFLLILCAVMIVGMWVNLKSVRKKLMKSLSELKDDTYTASLFEKGIEIITHTEEENQEIPATCLLFSNEDLYVLDKEEMYLLYLKKQMFYLIPKKNLTKEQEKLFSEAFIEKLQNRYSSKKEKTTETNEKA